MIVRDQGRFTVYWRGSGRVPFLRGRFDCPSCCLTCPRMAALSCFLVAIGQVFHSGLPRAAAASLSPVFRALLVRRSDSFAGFLQSAALAPGGRGLLCFDRSAKRVHEVLVYGSVSQFMTEVT